MKLFYLFPKAFGKKESFKQQYLTSLRTKSFIYSSSKTKIFVERAWYARYQGVCLFEKHFVVTGDGKDKILSIVIRQSSAEALKEDYPFVVEPKTFQNMVRRHIKNFILYGFNPALGLFGRLSEGTKLPTFVKQQGKYYVGVKLINWPPTK